jgi:hypothetical protein
MIRWTCLVPQFQAFWDLAGCAAACTLASMRRCQGETGMAGGLVGSCAVTFVGVTATSLRTSGDQFHRSHCTLTWVSQR